LAKNLSVAVAEAVKPNPGRLLVKSVTAVSAEAFSVLRTARGKFFVVSLASIASLKNNIAKIINFAITNTQNFLKAGAKIFAVALGNRFSETAGKFATKTVIILFASIINISRQNLKVLSIQFAETVKIMKLMSKTFGIALPETVKSFKAAGKGFITSIGNALLFAKLPVKIRAFTSATAQALKNPKSVSKIILIPLIVIQNVVKKFPLYLTIFNTFAMKIIRVIPKVLSAPLGLLGSLIDIKQAIKIIVASTPVSVRYSRALTKYLNFYISEQLNALRRISTTIYMALLQSMSSRSGIVKKLTMTLAQAPALLKSLSKIILVPISEKILEVSRRYVPKTFTVASGNTFKTLRGIGKNILFQNVSILALVRSSRKVFSVFFSEAITISRSLRKYVTFALSETVTALKSSSKAFRTSIGQIVTLTRSFPKIMQASLSLVQKFTEQTGHYLRFTVYIGNAARLQTMKVAIVKTTIAFAQLFRDRNATSKTISTALTWSIRSYKAAGKKLTVSIGETLTGLRAIGKILPVWFASSFTSRVATNKILRFVSGQFTSVLKQIQKSVLFVNAQTVKLIKGSEKIFTIALPITNVITRQVRKILTVTIYPMYSEILTMNKRLVLAMQPRLIFFRQKAYNSLNFFRTGQKVSGIRSVGKQIAVAFSVTFSRLVNSLYDMSNVYFKKTYSFADAIQAIKSKLPPIIRAKYKDR
jgi:hypothetical protein